MKDLIDINEASKKLGLSTSTIYKYSSGRKLPYIKIGAALRFREEELENWIEKQSVRPVTEK